MIGYNEIENFFCEKKETRENSMAKGISMRDELIHASNQNELIDSDDRLSSEIYDPLVDLATLFNSSSDLASLDQLLAYVGSYRLDVEKEILKRERNYHEQTISGTDSVLELTGLEQKLDQLVEDFDKMQLLAEDTGNTINDMTVNIKRLDNCKKNLTLSMTIMKRLQMLLAAYSSLEKLMNTSEEKDRKKDYNEIKQMLGAVLELMQHFQSYKSIDEINTLDKKILSMKNRVIDDIFSDFEAEIKGRTNNTLIDACEILAMFGEAYKAKLQSWYMKDLLKDLTTIFKSSEEAGSLDNIKRRYIFFQRVLNDFELHHSKNFPKSWKMPILLAKTFCSITKADLSEVMRNTPEINGSSSGAKLIISALTETLQFETYLNQKFKIFSDLDDKLVYNFDKSISDVFEPFLNIWIDHQGTLLEKKFLEYLNPTTMYRKSGVADSTAQDSFADKAVNQEEKQTNENSNSIVVANEEINVLESSADLFRTFRQVLSQLIKLTKGRPLAKLSLLFSKDLIEFKKKILEPMLPSKDDIFSADSKGQKEAIEIICLVLNTADYCSVTISQLEERLLTLITPDNLRKEVDFSRSKNAYLELITNCINLILSKIDNDLQYSWREMNNNNWRLLKDVDGESRYVATIKKTLNDDCDMIFSLLSKAGFIRNLTDKLVQMIVNSFIFNFVKLKPISEVMAEQFTLDLQTLKYFFMDLPAKAPNGSKIKGSRSFTKSVNHTTEPIISLMKVLMTPGKPTDSYLVSYFSNIKDSNFNNFIKTIKLKGLLSNDLTLEKDKFKYADAFKAQLRIYQDQTDEQLSESNKFIERLALNPTRIHKSITSTSMKLESEEESSLSSSLPTANITNFFGGGNPTRRSLFNGGDIEKNFVKTLTDNRMNINENFRNFGKFFKKGGN